MSRAMLPAEGVLRAAQRWLQLLGRSSVDQGLAIIKADPHYTDLSLTQYASALDWLLELGLASATDGDIKLTPEVRRLPSELISQALYSRSLEQLNPSWLVDADVLVSSVTELPQDAVALAGVFGLEDRVAFTAMRQLWGRVDLEELARIGAAGEAALVRLLEHRWPGSTRHVSLESDAFGYDVLVTIDDLSWHIEIKTTPRRGRLAVHLSRHEYQVAENDTAWHMVIVGLENEVDVGALATVFTASLLESSPVDRDSQTEWRLARYRLSASHLQRGLPFLPSSKQPLDTDRILDVGSVTRPSRFEWMPD